MLESGIAEAEDAAMVSYGAASGWVSGRELVQGLVGSRMRLLFGTAKKRPGLKARQIMYWISGA